MAVAGTAVTAVDDVLAPYVPRLVAEWGSSGAGEQPWRVVDGTLVFADISGFTALSERLAKHGPIGAEELTEVLGRCFAELLAVAYARGGSLVKFGGDALLLLFDGEGHAARGVDAALGMRATMRRVGRLVTSVGNVRLRMSLGVHSGPVHAFLVGGSHRELLLVGPAPSTVVTMEGTADAGEIVVSPATASRVDASLLAGAKGPGVLLRPRLDAAPLPAAATAPFPVRPAADDAALAAGVPTVLREHLLGGGGESEHRHASIAFLHFDGTDDLIARRGVEWVAGALERLVRDVQAAAEEHGATFLASDLDHDGGKLILVGGVPRSLGDDDGRVLRSVRQVVDASAAEAGGDGIPVRVGINRGPVFVGAVGPPYRRTFTVMGDAVNLAARLMAKASPGQVLASAGVLAGSRTAFSTTALEPFSVKGKSKPVQAFAVGDALGTQETRRSARLPLVGRDAELEVLTEAWAAAADGRGRVVVLSGEVGVGKTRLVEELRAVAGAAGGELRLVQCEQYEQRTPYFAARLLLAAALGVADGAHAADVVARVAATAPALVEWSPLVGDVLGIAVPENKRTRDLEAQFRRERTSQVVGQLLRSALGRPALLAFEDVQWLDDASAGVVTELAASARSEAWLLVLTQRDDTTGDTIAGLDGATRLEVVPLAAEAANELVLAATADAPIRPERRRAIVERAEGNPLFLEELVSFSAGASGDDELPTSLDAIVSAQLDRLPPRDGGILRVAAVLGVSFEPGLLREVAGEDAELVGALSGHLLAEPDGRLRFRHRLLRDVAYGLLPYRRRQELHARAADAILAATSGDGLERAEVLSFHCFAARRYEDCVRYASAAGDRAKRRHAVVEAGELYERAIAAARRVDRYPSSRLASLWTRLGVIHQTTGDYAAANEAFAQARRLSGHLPLELARVAIRHAEIAEREGNHVAVARWIGRGLRAIDGLDTAAAQAERAYLLTRRAGLRYRLGRPADALRWARKAVQVAEASGKRAAMADAYTMLDAALIASGRLDLATNSERAAALYRRLRNLNSLATVLNNAGAMAYYQGRWTDALRLYDEARETFERVGNVVDAALGSSNIAEIFADQGRLDEAEALLRDAIETWRSLAFPLGTARATRYLARVVLRRGDATGALGLFDEARALFDSYGLAANVHEVDVWRAECLLRLGRLTDARRLLDEALAAEISDGSTDLRPLVHRLRAAAAAADGRLTDAWAEADESLHHARLRGASFDVALGLETVATLARLGGRPLDEDARREREQLLLSLGVVASPPPLPVSVAAD